MRTVTVKKNLWFFGSKPPAKKAKRSSATIGGAMKAAYAAGKKSGDTGLFRSWLESAGLGDRSDTLISKLQAEYDRGFEANFEAKRERESKPEGSAFTYKRMKVVPTEGGWKLTGRFDDGTVFDSKEDAKEFIDSWNRVNPKKRRAA